MRGLFLYKTFDFNSNFENFLLFFNIYLNLFKVYKLLVTNFRLLFALKYFFLQFNEFFFILLKYVHNLNFLNTILQNMVLKQGPKLTLKAPRIDHAIRRRHSNNPSEVSRVLVKKCKLKTSENKRSTIL